MWPKEWCIPCFSITFLLVLPATENAHFIIVNLSELRNLLPALFLYRLKALHPFMLPGSGVPCACYLLSDQLRTMDIYMMHEQRESEMLFQSPGSTASTSLCSAFRGFQLFVKKIPNFLPKKQEENFQTHSSLSMAKPQKICCCFLAQDSRTCLARDWSSQLSFWRCFMRLS